MARAVSVKDGPVGDARRTLMSKASSALPDGGETGLACVSVNAPTR